MPNPAPIDWLTFLCGFIVGTGFGALALHVALSIGAWLELRSCYE